MKLKLLITTAILASSQAFAATAPTDTSTPMDVLSLKTSRAIGEFINHPSHCRSSVEGRVSPYPNMPSSKSPEDVGASQALQAIMKYATTPPMVDSILQSVYQNCLAKIKKEGL